VDRKLKQRNYDTINKPEGAVEQVDPEYPSVHLQVFVPMQRPCDPHDGEHESKPSNIKSKRNKDVIRANKHATQLVWSPDDVSESRQ